MPLLILVSGGVLQRYGSSHWFVTEDAQTVCRAHAEPDAPPWHHHRHAAGQSQVIWLEVQRGRLRGGQNEDGAGCRGVWTDTQTIHLIQDQQDYPRTQLWYPAIICHRKWIRFWISTNIKHRGNLAEDRRPNMRTKLTERESETANRERTGSAEWELVQETRWQTQTEISGNALGLA